MIGGLNTAILGSAGALEAEVENWLSRIAENNKGGSTRETLEALNEFIISIKNNNFIHKIKRCNLFCGVNLHSALRPVIIGDNNKKTIGNTVDENNGFFEADYGEESGLSANGKIIGSAGQAWLETDAFITSVGMDKNNGHLSIMTNNISADEYCMPICGGDYSSPSSLSAFIEFGIDGNLRACSPSSLSLGSEVGYVEVESPTKSEISSNVWTANRTSKTNQKLYKSGEEYDNLDATLNQDNYVIGGYKFRIFGAYSGGQVTQTSNGKILFYSLGEALTESEISILSDAVKLFNVRIGRS